MTREILIVDDTPDCLFVLRGMIEGQGYRVRTAKSGPDALAQVASHSPDLVLLDVMMPEMSGIEVLERLRADPVTAAIPVILVTARTDDDDVMSGYQVGADYYITKPCTARQVLRGIALVLGESEAHAAAACG
jgi:two-component system alkaline phosphatase synthesis response regulator PhoP